MRVIWPMLLLVTACGSEAPPSEPPAPVACGEAPAPLVGGTPETDAVADDAAQCGQAPFAWLREGLGEVVSVTPPTPITAQTISSLADALALPLPVAPEHDVSLRVMTYVTQDRGTLLEATALVAAPVGMPPTTELDMVLYLHGSSGFNDDCASSNEADTRLLSSLLASLGHVVVAPDYLGLKNGGEPTGFLNPALVGQPTAIASLDGLRAAMRLDEADREGVCASPRFVTIGGSQGGHAALWVDRLGPYYARELTSAGTVATVPPADMLGELSRAVTNLDLSSGSASIFFSTGAPWYGHEARLDEVLEPPQDTAIPERLATSCSQRFTDEFASIDQLFTANIRDAATAGTLADLDPWGCMAQENGLVTTSVPRLADADDAYGIFMITASDDEIVHTPTERGAFETMCEAGLPIRYQECAGATHIEGTLWSVGEILDFVDARFGGEPFAPDGCTAPAPVTCSGTP